MPTLAQAAVIWVILSGTVPLISAEALIGALLILCHTAETETECLGKFGVQQFDTAVSISPFHKWKQEEKFELPV